MIVHSSDIPAKQTSPLGPVGLKQFMLFLLILKTHMACACVLETHLAVDGNKMQTTLVGHLSETQIFQHFMK